MLKKILSVLALLLLASTVQAVTAVPCTTAGVGEACLQWTQEMTWTDGAPLTNLSGFNLYYSETVGGAWVNVGQVTPGSARSHLITGLTPGKTYYFMMKGYTSSGVVSAASNTLAKGVSAPPQLPVPVVTISANPNSGVGNVIATITWSSINATSCVASGGWAGDKATSGSETQPNIVKSTSYELTCTGEGGSSLGSTVVSVTPKLRPPVLIDNVEVH